MRRRILIVLLLILVTPKSIFAQHMLKEVSLSEQIKKSSLVIEGSVLSKKSFWDTNHEKIYTVNVIEVHKVFKGELSPIIEIITLGGVVDFDAQVVTPSLRLKVKDTGVFVLYESNIKIETHDEGVNEKRFEPYGSLNGFYRYNMYDDIAANRFISKKGITSSFYQEIESYTNSDYIQLSDFKIQNKTLESNKISNVLPLVVNGFSPTSSTAGTKSVLSITGSNFGMIKGKVGFYNADNAGASYINALDSQILSWTDTEITIEIPSEAGTGKIRITHDDGGAVVSNNTLTINYAQANIITDQLNTGVDIAYQAQLVSDNGNGGYNWEMTSDFANTIGATEAFERALKTWSCETRINWNLNKSSVITSGNAQHKSVYDNINAIAFDDSTSQDNDLPDMVLGRRTAYYGVCEVNGGADLKWYVKEFDIIFDDEADWNFDSDFPSSSELDFESVALHELGHCRQLDHIINTDNVMHFNIKKGESLRTLNSQNIEIANIIQNKSTSTPICNQSLMINYSANCALGIEEEKLNDGIKIYPNPTKGEVFINSDGLINLQKAVIYDVGGRLISEYNLSNSSRIKEINMKGISKGIYFVNIHSDLAMITKKIILD